MRRAAAHDRVFRQIWLHAADAALRGYLRLTPVMSGHRTKVRALLASIDRLRREIRAGRPLDR